MVAKVFTNRRKIMHQRDAKMLQLPGRTDSRMEQQEWGSYSSGA
tara:strand:- start:55 stop:186 length:132 start_codon:yes stop_codon:yes gene_type:complete